MSQRNAVIIGAGPAGLTVAYELLQRTDIRPLVFEASDGVGGIARTFNYKNNRIDIGGHRFFSKSDRVMEWWTRMLPLQRAPQGEAAVSLGYQNATRWLDMPADGPDPDETDEVMLLRPRVSRILFRGQLFDYPLSLSLRTLGKLGGPATVKIGASYMRSAAFPIRPEHSLEDFIINRFGRELYGTFFKDYTEKVWGVPCAEISAEWGAQRIKGVSLAEVLRHAARALLPRRRTISQKDTETSLIEQFLYPKFGPGQMWEKVTDLVRRDGGEVTLNARVAGLTHADGTVTSAQVAMPNGEVQDIAADYVFSTMPVRDLAACLDPAVPEPVRDVADGLMYRDFITVGLLLRRLKMAGGATGKDLYARMPDNWIYVQEPGVTVGRLQFFNNWSPYLVSDPDLVWIGLEYFCNEGDAIWSMPDGRLAEFGAEELEKINVIDRGDVIDSVVIRVPKTYPAYFGSYDRFDVVREYVDGFDNLFLLGRNGMHRYNNQDHSMLTAMVAVDNIAAGIRSRENLWSVNTETEYHEEK